jgi:hypothetical protein
MPRKPAHPDFESATRVSFNSTGRPATGNQVIKENIMPPAVSTVNPAANKLVRRLLLSLLDQAPWVTLVCLKIIDANAEEWEADQPHFRVTSSVRLHRREDAAALRLPPVPNWEALLPALRTGRRPVLRVADLAIGAASNGPPAGTAFSALVCPAANPQGDLLGAVFLVFDLCDGASRAELKRLAEVGTRVGSQIAAVLDLGGRAGAGTPYHDAA